MFNALACMPNMDVELYSAIAPSDFGLTTIKNEDLLFKWNIRESNSKSRIDLYGIKNGIKATFNSDVVIHFADFKHASLFATMFSSIILRKKLYLHGQGGYKKNGVLHKIIYNLSLLFSDGYICYSKFSEQVIKRNTFKFLHKKVYVVDNSLYLPQRKVPCFGSHILFIGRCAKVVVLNYCLKQQASQIYQSNWLVAVKTTF